MKIIDLRNIHQVCFGSINKGNTFIYCDKLYIKIENSKYKCANDDIISNAVKLENGCGAFFDDSDIITPVECEVTILNK